MKLFLQLFIYVLIGRICLSCNTPTNNESDNSLSLELSILDSSGKQVTEFSKSDTVSFLLTIQNNSDDFFTVPYCSSQQYDFYMQMDNDIVWKWSNNKAFLLITMCDTITPYEIIKFTEKWPDEQVKNILTGDYILVGEHTGAYTGTKTESFHFSIVNHQK